LLNVNLMLNLSILNVNGQKVLIMKQLLFILLSIFTFNLSAQNTCLIFDQSSKQVQNFDGDKMAFYKKGDPAKDQEDIIEIFETYYDNGQLAEKGLIVNNKPEGLWKKFDENGKCIAKIKYKEGKKTGKWIIWNYNGEIIAKGRYDNDGYKTGNWIYYSSIEQKYINKSF